jgi:hypothetical protein
MNDDHLAILQSGVHAWNAWRSAVPEVAPDLAGAQLSGRDLRGINFDDVNLEGASLFMANLGAATLRRSDLTGCDLVAACLDRSVCAEATLTGVDAPDLRAQSADLYGVVLDQSDLCSSDFARADLRGASLAGADLSDANLYGAVLRGTSLAGASLRSACLERASLVDADLSGASLSGCRVYGVSVWDVRGRLADESGLVCTPFGQPTVSVDTLAMAQFVYLLLSRAEIRSAVETITSKVVLILGRFTDTTKTRLDELAHSLRLTGLVPIMYDFDGPATRDHTETVMTMASLAKVVVADLSDPRSVPHELATIIPHFPSVPVVPIIGRSEQPYGMFEHLQRYPWVRPLVEFDVTASSEELATLVIDAIEAGT